MKHIIVAVLALGLALSGCAKSTSVGDKLRDFEGSESLDPTTSPTPKKTTASKKPTPKKTTAPVRTGNTWQIFIRNTGEGYNPRERRVVVGDKVVFRNTDATTAGGHTFTGYDDDGKEVWDSGAVKNGGTWSWTVDAPVGTYTLRCKVVPYIVGGPFEVLAA